jgi:hypothetical protein
VCSLRLNVTRYTLEAARGVLLLASTSLLFCTFSSNFGRLAYELLISSPLQPRASTPLQPRASTAAPSSSSSSVSSSSVSSSSSSSASSLEEQLVGVGAVSLDLPWFAYP